MFDQKKKRNARRWSVSDIFVERFVADKRKVTVYTADGVFSFPPSSIFWYSVGGVEHFNKRQYLPRLHQHEMTQLGVLRHDIKKFQKFQSFLFVIPLHFLHHEMKFKCNQRHQVLVWLISSSLKTLFYKWSLSALSTYN